MGKKTKNKTKDQSNKFTDLDKLREYKLPLRISIGTILTVIAGIISGTIWVYSKFDSVRDQANTNLKTVTKLNDELEKIKNRQSEEDKKLSIENCIELLKVLDDYKESINKKSTSDGS